MSVFLFTAEQWEEKFQQLLHWLLDWPSGLVKRNGNISIFDIVKIARQMRSRSMAKALVGTVKEVLGTAQSIGCTIDKMTPHTVIENINEDGIEIPEE